MLRIRCNDSAVAELFKQFDVDGSGSFQLEELMKIVQAVEPPPQDDEQKEKSNSPAAVAFRGLKKAYHLVTTDTMQTVLYIAFVMIVQVRCLYRTVTRTVPVPQPGACRNRCALLRTALRTSRSHAAVGLSTTKTG